MSQDGFDIEHLAELARMTLTDDEKARFSRELEKVLAYIEQLQQVDTGGVEETAQVTGIVNVFQSTSERPVEKRENLEALKKRRQEMFAAVPQTENGLVKIPAIFGEE